MVAGRVVQRVVGSICATVLAATLCACGGAQARKAGYLDKGREYLKQRDFEKARVEFRNALQLDPNDAEAAYLSGEATERTGNVREAAGLYQDAVQSNAAHTAARAALARLYLYAGEPDKALDLVNQGLAHTPNDPDLLIVRASVRVRSGDKVSALADAQAAARLAPQNENAVALLAALHNQQGETAKAVDLLRHALQAPSASADLRAVLAQLYFDSGRRAEGSAELGRVIAQAPRQYVYRFQLAQSFQQDFNWSAAEATLRQAVRDLPQSTEARLGLVDYLEERGARDAAEAELKAAANSNPDDAQYLLRLSELYTRHGKVADAVRLDEQLIKNDDSGPAGLAARTHLARIYVATDRPALATPLIETILKQNPRDNDALLIRAELALARGQALAAVTDLRAVAHDQPNSLPVQRTLARAYLRAGDITLAEETLRAALARVPSDAALQLELARVLTRSRRLDQAIPLLSELVREHPDDLTALESLFDAQLAQQNFAAAKLVAQRLQADQPKLPVGSFMEGTLELTQKHLDAARVAYERAAALAPDAVEPVIALVRVDLAQTHQDQALARLDRSIARLPREPVFHNVKGEVLASTGQTSAAIAAWRQASALAPRWDLPYRNLANVQLASGDSAGAVRTLRGGIDAAQGNADLVIALAALYERIGRADDAIAQYEAFLKVSGGTSAVANNLAMLLITHRQDQASLDRARALSQNFANSKDPALVDTWGWVLYKRGEAPAASAVLQQAVDRAPQLPELRYHLALAQLKLGSVRDARDNLDKALAADASFNDLEDARRLRAGLDAR